MLSPPRIDPELVPTEAANPAVYVRTAFEGGDLARLVGEELARLSSPAEAASAFLNLATLYQLAGRRDDALACQAAALERSRLFRHAAPRPAAPPLRLLAIVTAGDLMTNTPVELMLEGRAVEITKLFVRADDEGFPPVPDHDLAMLAVGESDDARALLQRLDGVGGRWPRPMINDAARSIAGLARDRLHLALAGAPGILIPPTVRMAREDFAAAASEAAKLQAALGGATFPIIVRPVGSHAGKALERLDGPEQAAAYLDEQPSPLLYVSPFIDYRSPDGRFPKYRIAVFGGRPYLAHLAIGEHWMVHYLNAGMAADPDKRAREEQAMLAFDEDFARRHAAAFAAMTDRLGLDYFAIDCAEAPDGSLLVFEADVAMIVHDLDPADLYPYKKRQMGKLFDAFEAFLRSHAGRR